jgi:hypothetical protein
VWRTRSTATPRSPTCSISRRIFAALGHLRSAALPVCCITLGDCGDFPASFPVSKAT